MLIVIFLSERESKSIISRLDFFAISRVFDAPPSLSKKRFDNVKNYIIDNNLKLRFHLPYSYIEIAHNEKEIQTYSISVIKEYLKFIAALKGHYAIIHVGYYEGSDTSIALKNLELLANYSYDLGIKLCIENLISGLTANPYFLVQALMILVILSF